MKIAYDGKQPCALKECNWIRLVAESEHERRILAMLLRDTAGLFSCLLNYATCDGAEK